MKKLIVTVALIGVLVIGGCAKPSQPQQTQVCEEDQRCWDCDTMGNGVCGEDLPLGVIVLPASECPLFQSVCFGHRTPRI